MGDTALILQDIVMLEAWSNEQREFIKEEAQFLIYLDCWQIAEKNYTEYGTSQNNINVVLSFLFQKGNGYFSDRKYSFSQRTNSDNLWPAKQLDFLTLPYLNW